MISSYSNLTIGQFDVITSIINSSDDNKVKDARILSILSDIPTDSILSMPADEVVAMLNSAKFLAVPPTTSNITTFQYQGFTFNTPSSLTYSQYIDVEASTDYSSLLHSILIPEGHSYNDGYVVDFFNLPCVLGLSVVTSFMNGLVVSSVASVKSSLRKLLRHNPLLIFSKSYRTLQRSLRSIHF